MITDGIKMNYFMLGQKHNANAMGVSSRELDMLADMGCEIKFTINLKNN